MPEDKIGINQMQKELNKVYKEIFGNLGNFSVFAQFNGFSISLSPVAPNSSHAMSYFSAMDKISDDINRGIPLKTSKYEEVTEEKENAKALIHSLIH